MNNKFLLNLTFVLATSLLIGCKDDEGGKATLPEFRIAVSAEAQTSVHIEVTPRDKTATYVTMIASAEQFEAFAGDEERFRDDMDYIRRLASLVGKSFEEQLGELLIRGDYVDDLSELTPATDYYAYVYGVTATGERTTEMFCRPFSTLPLEMVDCTFDVTHMLEYAEVTLHVHPSKDDVAYHAGIIDDQTYMEWGGEADDTFQKWLNNEIAYYRIQGLSMSDALEKLTRKGDYSEVFDKLLPNSSYHICVFAVDQQGYIVSAVRHIPVMTGDKRPSGNIITITVDPATLTATGAVVETTVTDDSDYILYTDEASIYNGMSDEEIIRYILDDWGSDIGFIKTSGPQKRSVYCSPGKTYLVAAFGYKGGAATTQLFKYEFTTPAQ